MVPCLLAVQVLAMTDRVCRVIYKVPTKSHGSTEPPLLLNPLQPLWPTCCCSNIPTSQAMSILRASAPAVSSAWNMPRPLPDVLPVSSLLSFRSLFSCHLFGKTFPDPPSTGLPLSSSPLALFLYRALSTTCVIHSPADFLYSLSPPTRLLAHEARGPACFAHCCIPCA